MISKRLYTPGEIIKIRTNLDEIERHLRGPVPPGLIDPSLLKDRLLSPGEVTTICANLSQFKKSGRARRQNDYTGSDLAWSFIILTIVGTILWIAEKIFDVKIL